MFIPMENIIISGRQFTSPIVLPKLRLGMTPAFNSLSKELFWFFNKDKDKFSVNFLSYKQEAKLPNKSKIGGCLFFFFYLSH
uniref:Uncharacterized protein n=1 Tax=Rhizophora mucronata TaxID=61149 RepID=A0A2P2IR97_RHIMU